MRLLVTRPEPDADAQAERLRRLGHEPVLSPLLEIEFLDPPLKLYGVQALIVTSANAIRAADRLGRREALYGIPAYCVGAATAEAARAAGFETVRQGPGTGKGLAALIAAEIDPDAGSLLHLAGETVSFDFRHALERFAIPVDVTVLYRTLAAKRLSPEAERSLDAGTLDGVILMSARTAQVFAALAGNRKAPLASLMGYCLSEAVAAELAGLGMPLRIAAHPGQEELLALIAAETPSS